MPAVEWPLGRAQDWARARRASFDVDTLTEMVKGQGLRHTGLSVEIFAEAEKPQLGEGGSHASADLWEALRGLASSVVGALPGVVAEVEAYNASEHLRAENHFTPEVQLRLTLTPSAAEGPVPRDWTTTVRARLEHGLRERGLAAKAWSHARSA